MSTDDDRKSLSLNQGSLDSPSFKEAVRVGSRPRSLRKLDQFDEAPPPPLKLSYTTGSTARTTSCAPTLEFESPVSLALGSNRPSVSSKASRTAAFVQPPVRSRMQPMSSTNPTPVPEPVLSNEGVVRSVNELKKADGPVHRRLKAKVGKPKTAFWWGSIIIPKHK